MFSKRIYPLDISEFAPAATDPFAVTDSDVLKWFNDLVTHPPRHQHERRFVERIQELLKAQLPKTKEIEVWRFEWAYKGIPGGYQMFNAPEGALAALKNSLDAKDYSARSVTGPHKQLVPAD